MSKTVIEMAKEAGLMPTVLAHRPNELKRLVELVRADERAKLAEQPAQQEIDWKDQYEKQKRRADMWVAKYEADIGPLEKAGPVAEQPAPAAREPVAQHRDLHSHMMVVAHRAADAASSHGQKPTSQKAFVRAICTAIQADKNLLAKLTPQAQPAPAAQQEPVACFIRGGVKGARGEDYAVEFFGGKPLPPDGALFYTTPQAQPAPKENT